MNDTLGLKMEVRAVAIQKKKKGKKKLLRNLDHARHLFENIKLKCVKIGSSIEQ